jgi:Flp pilus assembly protein CpaB
VVLVAVICGVSVAATMHRADQARRAWGRPTPVIVAEHDVGAGEALDASNTRREERPGPLVPDGALSALPDGARVREPVYADEVVRSERLAEGGGSAVAARLPICTRAVAVPLDPSTSPPLELGDRVDVVVAVPAEAAGGRPPGFTLATDVLVVAVDDQAATVAVSADVAPRLVVAFGQGLVSLAVVGA